MAMKRKKYRAVWLTSALREAANVDIMTTSDHNAIQSAGKLEREMGVSNCSLTIHESGRLVHSRPHK